MIVSYLPDPENHPLWEGIKRLLEPAAKLGGIAVRDEQELVWVVFEERQIFAAFTTALWLDGEAEIRLAGGTRLKDWVHLVDEAASEWARAAGASRLTIRGRAGWKRFAERFGWVLLGTEDGRHIFEKAL